MSESDRVYESIVSAILSGNGIASVQATEKALALGESMDAIITRGVLKAWSDFCAWHAKDPKASLRIWLDCFNATQKILKCLESKMVPPREPPFSVLVVTVLGEGHTLMRDILTTVLRYKGLKVHTSKRGVRIDDVSEALLDPKLSYVVLSCIEPKTLVNLRAFIGDVRKQRPDVAIIAGGPMANESGADLVLNDPTELGHTMLGYSESA